MSIESTSSGSVGKTASTGPVVAPSSPGSRDRPDLLAVPVDKMPANFDVSLENYIRGGTDTFLIDGGETKQQNLQGFEPKYRNIIDYIVRITHRIWEQRDIGYIYDTYSHKARVWDDVGLQYGRDKIVADTTHTINAFPDIRLYADDIVWAGDDEQGFHTSHRTIIKGTNSGFSRYGPPSGRKVHVWCIANCVALENEIFEEHVLYNVSSMLSQLGIDLKGAARAVRAQKKHEQINFFSGSEQGRLPGQGKPDYGTPRGEGPFDIADFLRSHYQDVWNRRMLGRLEKDCASNLLYHGPTNRVYHSLGQYRCGLLSLLAIFPDLSLNLDSLYYMGDPNGVVKTALRWSATASHTGYGPYGEPTGREVRIWGITQHKIVNETIVEDWTMFNEFDLLCQLADDVDSTPLHG